MPTDKRQRQREGREYRRAQLQAAQKRRGRRRQAYIFGVLAVGIGVVIAVLNISGGSKPTNVAAKGSTTTSTTSASSTTSTTSSTPAPASSVAASELSCFGISGNPSRKTKFSAAPPMCINSAKSYKAVVQTDVGTFDISLDPKAAPKTVNNFVYLSLYHYYDGIVFHRVIPGFVVQGGDPTGTGTGGPGYQFADELPKAGAYKIGSLAMANSGPSTNGSQFFIITGSQGVQLPPQYSLFGQVTTGMSVVSAIEKDGTTGGTPKVEHHMVHVTIEES
ncbi:MAG TPA: peptidylprolyl isomerase [Acidimicrobiales bacterium]|nr:peptidylprolyl isomerase [Acidimicrobiales bacterium]